ncbi:hypothetical protein B7463_g12651, partial [Scytalidium lignicola]
MPLPSFTGPGILSYDEAAFSHPAPESSVRTINKYHFLQSELSDAEVSLLLNYRPDDSGSISDDDTISTSSDTYASPVSDALVDSYPLLPNTSTMILVDCETGLIYEAEATLRQVPKPRPGSIGRFEADLERIPFVHEEVPAQRTQSYKILPAKWISLLDESETGRKLVFIGSLLSHTSPGHYTILPVDIQELDRYSCPAVLFSWYTCIPKILGLKSLSKLVEIAALYEHWKDEKELTFDPIDDFNYFLKKNTTYKERGSPCLKDVTRAMIRHFRRVGGLAIDNGSHWRLPRDAHLPFGHDCYKPLELDATSDIFPEAVSAKHRTLSNRYSISTYEKWFEDCFLPLRQQYYDAYNRLSMSYKRHLIKWCPILRGRVLSSVTDHPPCTKIARNEISFGRQLLLNGRGTIDDALGLRHIRIFLEQWKPWVPAGVESVEKLTTIRCIWVFAELLLRDSMEDEKALWEDVILLHTGLTLEEIVRDYREGAGSVVHRDELAKHRKQNYESLYRFDVS